MKEVITLEQVLNNKNFEKEFNSIIINNDKPISFKKEDYKVIEGEPIYTDTKKNGRSGSAIAIITPNTLAIYTSEHIKYKNPVNWTKTVDEAGFFQRSHIIGYRLSAKINEFNNIFIGTQYLNQNTMYDTEQLIYDDISNNKREYIYKVTPVYKFKEDKVPFGILIEAKTIDKKEKKEICRFCYNIQDGQKINYYDGSNKPIEKVLKEKNNVIEIEKKTRKVNQEKLKYKDYKINIKTEMFHLLNSSCNALDNVEAKYIQETTAFEEDIIQKGFKLCKKCI